MKSPAGQGESCGAGASESAAAYCLTFGRPAAQGMVFCSEAHAEEFAREVAAVQTATEARG